jgi:hypothetical protein
MHYEYSAIGIRTDLVSWAELRVQSADIFINFRVGPCITQK